MINYTNKQLYQYFEILNNIASKVTGKLAYLVTKNARKISNELQEYIDIRNEKLRDFGEEVDGQIRLLYDSPNYSIFLDAMKEYDDIEQEISFLKAEPADLFSSSLNAIEIDQLSFMINDEEDA